ELRRAGLDAGRDAHPQRLRRRHQPASPARRARCAYVATGAATTRAGPLDRDGEDALLEAHPPATAASPARLGRRARSRPRAAAVAAGDDPVVAHRLLAAERRLLERHLELALDVALVAPADSEDAQQIPEDPVDGDVADVDEAPRERPACPEGRTRLLSAVPE